MVLGNWGRRQTPFNLKISPESGECGILHAVFSVDETVVDWARHAKSSTSSVSQSHNPQQKVKETNSRCPSAR